MGLRSSGVRRQLTFICFSMTGGGMSAPCMPMPFRDSTMKKPMKTYEKVYRGLVIGMGQRASG